MFLPLDGPSKQLKISVSNTSVSEIKVDSTSLSERKVITFQPTGGNIYIYFGYNDVIPSSSDVSNNGLVFFTNGVYTIEASDSQKVYTLAMATGTFITFVERA